MDTPYQYVVPVVARVPGLQGSSWKTAIQYTNPHDHEVTFYRWVFDSDGAAVTQSAWDTGPITVNLEDWVVATNLPEEFKGSLYYETSDPVDLSVRIYNDEVSRTYGQFIPVPVVDDLLSASHTAVVSFPISDGLSSVVNPFRHNLGWYQFEEGSVRFILHSSSGEETARVTRAFSSHELLQAPLWTFFGVPEDSHNVFVVVECLSGRGYAYGSTVDNRSQDPTTREMRIVD
jgi:hypothetical protein